MISNQVWNQFYARVFKRARNQIQFKNVGTRFQLQVRNHIERQVDIQVRYEIVFNLKEKIK